MKIFFADTLKKLREEKGWSQKQLAKRLIVNHSTITRWENGTRVPDTSMILRIANCFGVDPVILFHDAAKSDEIPNVIIVDDSKVVLADSLAVLEESMPNAAITGFVWPQEAIEFAKINRVALAVLDIELGSNSGFDLCRTLLDINPHTNIVFLTAYADYSLDAWKTEASGFMLKPLTPENVKEQLKKLRYPLSVGGNDR